MNHTKNVVAHRSFTALGLLSLMVSALPARAQDPAPAPQPQQPGAAQPAAPTAPAEPMQPAQPPAPTEPQPPAAEPVAPVAPAPAPAPAEPMPPTAPMPPPAAEPPPPAPVAVEPPVEAPPAEEPPSDRSVNFGVGIRAQYDFNPDVGGQNFGHAIGTNVRPYISGQAHKYVKFEGNLDSSFSLDLGTFYIRPLDVVAKFEFDDAANFWIGRFLPPSDRANLSGPYYQNAWNYPVQSNLFPAIYAGRHDGVAYWGQAGGGAFKWQLGAFDITGGDNPLVAARLVANVLDPEPGYYNSSTYYGSKDILAIGATIQGQDGGTVPGIELDGAAFEADVLFEKELSGSGTFTTELAYYNFADVDDGQSFWGLLSYLTPEPVGFGQIQPMVRLQYRDPEVGDGFVVIDGAIQYIIDGHNARLALNFQHDDGASNDIITFGTQLQL